MLNIRIILAIVCLQFCVTPVAAKLKPPKNIAKYKMAAHFSGSYSIVVTDTSALRSILQDLTILHPKPDDRAELRIKGNIKKRFEYMMKFVIEKDHKAIGQTELQMIQCGPIKRRKIIYFANGIMKLKNIPLPATTLFEVGYDLRGKVTLKYWVKSYDTIVFLARAAISRIDSFKGETVESLIGQEFKRGMDRLKQRVAELSGSPSPATNSK